jgi:carbonic anhydrase
MGAFKCPVDNVAEVVAIIRKSPLLPKSVPVHGLIFDPDDGHLEIIVRGY